MKLNRVLAPLCGAMVLVGGSAAYSQEVAPAPRLAQPLAAPGALAGKSVHPIRIKNVSARLMAFWLDPVNNPMPSALQASNVKSAARPPFQGAPVDPKVAKGAFKLPAGIDQIVAIDPQNAILVFGTDAGVRELQETINFLDRPLRQVEIEMQFVQVSDEDAKAFGIDFTTPQTAQTAGQPMLGYVRGNFQATLEKLVGAKKAKVITAPRATLINNFSGRLTAPISSAPVGYQGEDGQFYPLIDPAAPKNAAPLRATTSFGIEVTPTINNDDTVTMSINANQLMQLSSAGQVSLTTRTSGGIESIVNARNGDTILLRGLVSRLFAGLGQDKKAGASPILLFVTARILRRVGDDAVPGN